MTPAIAQRLSRSHFTALLSMIMALTALAIDLMLPAFDQIRSHYGLAADSSRVAQIVTTFFLGLALAQFFYGPIADRFGRKPTLYLGFAIYGVGALGSLLAPSLELVLISRFVWGIGAAGPRVVSISIVRDSYSGEEMSRAMSYIMAVFIMVPVLAPSLGVALIQVFPWQSVFAFCVVFVVVIGLWSRVLPETLDPANRLPINTKAIMAATREVLTTRLTIGYTAAMTVTFGVFSSYLASSERIFGDFYDRADEFPFLFGGVALIMGIAILGNAKLVGRIGTRRMTHSVLVTYVAAAAVINIVSVAADGHLPFLGFMAGLVVMVGLHALLIPNFNTIALQPMGHIAGTASAVTGTLSMAGGAFLGATIDSTYTDSAAPLLISFLIFGALALVAVAWAERGKLFAKPPPDMARPEPVRPTVR